MHARISEADHRKCRGEEHLPARRVVGGILDGTHEILRDHLDRARRPNFADRIRALIRRPQAGILRGGALIVGDGCQRFDGMAQHISAG